MSKRTRHPKSDSHLESNRITLTLGDISKVSDVDAIVNSANSNLRLGSGVSGAIHTAAGPKLEKYCAPYRPLELGQTLLTPGFKLPVPWIIHAKAPHYLEDAEPQKWLAKVTQAVLQLAGEQGFQRIALPAFSTGLYRFPAEEAAQILMRTIAQHLEDQSSSLIEVRIVLGNPWVQDVFEAALKQYGRLGS